MLIHTYAVLFYKYHIIIASPSDHFRLTNSPEPGIKLSALTVIKLGFIDIWRCAHDVKHMT